MRRNPEACGRFVDFSTRVAVALARGFWGLVVPATVILLTSIALAQTDLAHLVQLARERYGASAAQTVDNWRQLVERSRSLDDLQKLETVNTFFNRSVIYSEDQVVWNMPDYWATPLETMGRGAGDCEDFSIAKYVTLGLLGMPIDKLRLTYVRAELGLPGSGITQAHMVLAYYPAPGTEPLILDNLVGELRPASRRPDLKPIFGFNSQGLWVAGSKATADPTARLSRWRDLLQRMNDDGLN